MELDSTRMEFASEIITDAGARDLTIAKVLITYRPRKGEATLDSFRDEWRHVRFMLIDSHGNLFSIPGAILATANLLVLLVSLSGVTVGSTEPGVRSGVAGGLVLLVGAQVTCLGAFATVAGEPVREADDPTNPIHHRPRSI